MNEVIKVVKALGGPVAVSKNWPEKPGPTPASIQMWCQRGWVPWKWREVYARLVDKPKDAA